MCVCVCVCVLPWPCSLAISILTQPCIAPCLRHRSIGCRYYMEKMQAPPGKQDKIIRDIVASYVEGLCWVMRYYYEGVASWEW